MAAITWNAEGGTDGVDISTANSGGASGTAWDLCTKGTNATNQYDDAQKANGTYSALVATGANSVQAHNRWTTGITNTWASGLTTHYGRFYFRLAALPAANRVLVEFTDAAVSVTRATFFMLTTGALRLRNRSGGTVATFTNLCSVDTWYRVEYRIDGSATGAYEMHLYAGNDLTAIEDIVGGTADFGGAIGAAQYGYVANGANLASLWFDGIQINDVGLPSIESAGGQTANLGQATSTETANAVGKAKSKAIGQATSTEVANPVGKAKTKATAQAASTEAANPVTVTKVVYIGQAVETSTATAIGKAKVKAVGQATSTETATAIGDVDARDLQIIVGRPETKWHAGRPGTKWAIGAPHI